jgi:hypothetical protein
MYADEGWPYLNPKCTYVVGHPDTLAVIKPGHKRRTFRRDLEALNRIPLREQLRFVKDALLPPEYIYICDMDGMWLVIEVQWLKKQKKEFTKKESETWDS